MSHATTQTLEYDQFTHLFAKCSILVNFYLRHNLCSMPPPDEIVREHMFPKNVSTQAELVAPPPVKLKREHMCGIYLHLVRPSSVGVEESKHILHGHAWNVLAFPKNSKLGVKHITVLINVVRLQLYFLLDIDKSAYNYFMFLNRFHCFATSIKILIYIYLYNI